MARTPHGPEQVDRQVVAAVPAASEQAAGQVRFEIGTEVNYFSKRTNLLSRGSVQGYNDDGSYLLYHWKNPADASALAGVLHHRADPSRVAKWPGWPPQFPRPVLLEAEGGIVKAKGAQLAVVPLSLLQAEVPTKAAPPKLQAQIVAAVAAGQRCERAVPPVKPPPVLPALPIQAAATARLESGVSPLP